MKGKALHWLRASWYVSSIHLRATNKEITSIMSPMKCFTLYIFKKKLPLFESSTLGATYKFVKCLMPDCCTLATSFCLCSQNVPFKFPMGSHQVLNMFPRFPMCSWRVFSIAPQLLAYVLPKVLPFSPT